METNQITLQEELTQLLADPAIQHAFNEASKRAQQNLVSPEAEGRVLTQPEADLVISTVEQVLQNVEIIRYTEPELRKAYMEGYQEACKNITEMIKISEAAEESKY